MGSQNERRELGDLRNFTENGNHRKGNPVVRDAPPIRPTNPSHRKPKKKNRISDNNGSFMLAIARPEWGRGGPADRDDDHDDDDIVDWSEQPYGVVADHDRHAVLRYNDVAGAGPPARPLDFPAPEVFRGERVDLRARDHKSGRIHHLKNVLLRSGGMRNNNNNNNRRRPRNDAAAAATMTFDSRAYFETKQLSKTVYGCVNLCIVLKRIDGTSAAPEGARNPDDDDDDDDGSPSIEWESTDLLAAVKISEWRKIQEMRGKHLEDPIKEISAMQLVGNHHRHVLGTWEALQDDKHLYTITPYLGGGHLTERLLDYVGHRSLRSGASGGGRGATAGFDETSARIWFRHLLQAINLLQKKGICHRDICLENILLDDDDNLCLIDPGMSLRIPYTDSETGGVGDVSSGTSRRLLIAQGQGGKLMYAAPEIVARDAFVDAFATDLWSVGVVLFVMLVGRAPFQWAHPSDERYARMSRGRLGSVVRGLGIKLSPESLDLLQNFFWADPQRRFTLAEALRHPWVRGTTFREEESIVRAAAAAPGSADKPGFGVPPPAGHSSSSSSHNVFSFDANSLRHRLRSRKRS